MLFHTRLKEIGSGRRMRMRIKKRARDCERSPDMEADAERRRSRANREDDTAREGKSASFYWSTAAFFQFRTFLPPPQTLLKWHRQPPKSTFPVYCMWSCQSLSGSMGICWFLSLYCRSTRQLSYPSICPPLPALHACQLVTSFLRWSWWWWLSWHWCPAYCLFCFI